MSASAPITPQGGPAGGPAGGPSGAPMGDPAAMAQMLDMFSGMTGMLNDSRTVLACALAIYAWDWLVTLPQERRHIWKDRPYMPTNIAFLVNRYFTIFSLSIILYLYYPSGDAAACRRMYLLPVFLPLITYTACFVIISARVYAIWLKNRIVLGALCALYLARLSVQIWAAQTAEPVQVPPNLPPYIASALSNCLPEDTKDTAKYYWSIMMFTEAIVFILVMSRTLGVWRQGGTSSLIRIIIRDQIFFYALTLCINIANLVYILAARGETQNPALLTPLATALTSIAAARILLNLKETHGAHSPSSSGSNKSSGSGSGSGKLSGKKVNLPGRGYDASSGFATPSARSPAFQSPFPSDSMTTIGSQYRKSEKDVDNEKADVEMGSFGRDTSEEGGRV